MRKVKVKVYNSIATHVSYRIDVLVGFDFTCFTVGARLQTNVNLILLEIIQDVRGV